MNEEEKIAMKLAKDFTKIDFKTQQGWHGYYDEELEELSKSIKTILNLIKEQQENYQSCMDYADSLNQDIGELLLILEKKDKIINEMADRLEFVMKNSGIGLDPEHGMNFTINDIKEYFTKKVGE